MYIVIIMALISIILGGVLLIGYDNAVKTLSNGSTLLSIVLAVVAILITLWDVSGQKNSVYDIKKQVELLENLVEEDKINRNESTKIINSLFDLQDELKNYLEENKKNSQEIYSILTEIKEKGLDADITKKVEKLLDQSELKPLTELDFIPKNSRKNYLKKLIMQIVANKTSTGFEIYTELQNRNIDVTKHDLEKTLREMENDDQFFFLKQDNDGNTVYMTF